MSSLQWENGFFTAYTHIIVKVPVHFSNKQPLQAGLTKLNCIGVSHFDLPMQDKLPGQIFRINSKVKVKACCIAKQYASAAERHPTGQSEIIIRHEFTALGSHSARFLQRASLQPEVYSAPRCCDLTIIHSSRDIRVMGLQILRHTRHGPTDPGTQTLPGVDFLR